MKLRVIKPRPHSDPKLWQLQILDDRGQVIAESDRVSEADCRNAESMIRSACSNIPATEVVTRGAAIS
jgi:hypothetical protein